jgi:hypothetical protein
MIRAFVLFVVGASESVLVALFFVIARSAIVPILYVETAREADVLIGEALDYVGVARADKTRRRPPGM